MKYIVIGLSITSSWGNDHATTFRALLKELTALGNEVLFLEKDVPWYAGHRDMPNPDFCRLRLYETNEELKTRYANEVAKADAVIVGSFVPQGVEIGNWVIETARGVTAFYDLDTPVTLEKLRNENYEYINEELIKKYQLYLSFSGGRVLDYLEEHYDSPNAKALYCSVDTNLYFPEDHEKKWQMGYLGTYSDDRQASVEELLNETAKQKKDMKFIVAGPQYPEDIQWAENVERIDHLPPSEHRRFYNSQRYTLNITQQDMIRAGYSPTARLFEAAACGVPIISDFWNGIDSIFEINKEILIAGSSSDAIECFDSIDEEERKLIGQRARQKVLKYHTSRARAQQLESYVEEVMEKS
ncbi:glycosyltransferase [Christiangramia fulva]|uniref:Glycosyltransferase n=1 Tax=Christiangramia fulva TaxID=2126553 RepID=A0A2R3Z8T6_9FLAO|nr:glycosyltransferase [Christiangramia fulva]AVR46614.1 glycosyltransferase [Christiangramia fulva]